MTLGIIFALVCALGTAIGNIFLKKAVKNFSPFSEFFVFSIFSLILWPLTLFFIPFNQDRFLEGLLLGALSGLICQGYYIYVISKGKLSITSTLIFTFPIFTIIFVMIFSGETLTVPNIIAIVLIILGTLIVVSPTKDIENKIPLVLIILPLSVAFSIGFSDALSNRFIDSAGASTFLIATAIMQIPISIFLMMFKKERLSDITNAFASFKIYKNALLGALFLSIATGSIFLSFAFAPASIASPISGAAPVITALLAFLLLKEKLSPKYIFGILLVLVGIVIISF